MGIQTIKLGCQFPANLPLIDARAREIEIFNGRVPSFPQFKAFLQFPHFFSPQHFSISLHFVMNIFVGEIPGDRNDGIIQRFISFN
jgi:hypothetical protein